MKIGIDATSLLFNRPITTGIQYYIENIVNNIAFIDRDNEYIIYGYSWHNHYFEIKKSNLPAFSNFSVRLRKIPTKLISVMHKCGIPFEYLFGGIDIQHIHGPRTLCFRRRKKVITVYDLTYELFPQFHTKENISRYKETYGTKLKEMDKIIAISENTKKDLINLYKINPQRIKVIYGAADEIYRPVKDLTRLGQVKEKYNLPDRFILFVGVIEPRKNIVRLIKAYQQLKRSIQQKLVIVGEKGWLYEDVFKAIGESDWRDDIIFLNNIPKEDLACLYSACDLFVYPSLYEGFGLPPLEAMSCQAPVISSNTSSLPEVMGGAGILITPTSVEELSEAMYKVLTNATLREEMGSKGLERAKLFSWKKSAQETIGVYKEVYREKIKCA